MSNRQALKQKTLHYRAIIIALIVGSILCLINQGDFLLHGNTHEISWIKILLTYLVPYLVSLYSAISALQN